MQYETMKKILEEVREGIISSRFLEIQEVQSHAWILRFERASLFVSLKGPFAGFHLTELPWKGKRVTSVHKLIGKPLLAVELLNEDRILALTFEDHQQLVFEIFPQGTWHHTQNYVPRERSFTHNRTSPSLASREIDAFILQELKQRFFQKWKEGIEKKCAYFEKEIEEGKKWQEKMHEAELLQAYFFRLKKGMTSIEIEDWEEEGFKRTLSLDPDLEPAKIVQQAFTSARKLKRKLEIAQPLLEKMRQQLPPLFSFPAMKESRKTVPASPFREFTTESKLKILVGKKDKDNDALTFKIAQGSDLWFHSADTPGSHVVLKVHKKEPPDTQAIQDALQLALYYSKARGEVADVIMAACKHLSKPKGAKPGLVNVSHHKKHTVRPNPLRLSRLLGIA